MLYDRFKTDLRRWQSANRDVSDGTIWNMDKIEVMMNGANAQTTGRAMADEATDKTVDSSTASEASTNTPTAGRAPASVPPDRSPSPDLIDRIRAEAPRLPAACRAIADFLIMEGTGMDDVSMAELARQTFTSKPTIVRFAQLFGYDGWKSFHADFIACARRREERERSRVAVDFNYPFAVSDTPERIVDAVAKVHAATVDALSEHVDAAEFARAARTVLAARRVVILGNPPNRFLGEIFAFNVAELGIDCRVPHNEDAGQQVRYLDGRDCVIAISYSGGLARGCLKHVHTAHERGASIIGITGEGSPLARVADRAIIYRHREHYYSKIAGYFGCEQILLILDALHALCYAAHYEENDTARRQNARLWSKRHHIADEF